MDSTLLKRELDATAKSIQKAATSLVGEQDLELKKILVFDFFESLLEDELIQAEYSLQDIALIVLVFWDNSEKSKQLYSEKRIHELLTEPIQKLHFVHFTKQFEGDRVLAYEFVIKAFYIALSNNWLLEYAYEEVLKEVREEGTKENLIELPIKKREIKALEIVIQN